LLPFKGTVSQSSWKCNWHAGAIYAHLYAVLFWQVAQGIAAQMFGMQVRFMLIFMQGIAAYSVNR
jgi:hypothetical protein